MIIKTFREPPIDNNNYLVIDETTKDACLIDCSSPSIWDKVPYVQGKAKDYPEEINLKYILLTHGHFDHIGGIKPKSGPIKGDGIPPKIFMHKDDLNWVKNVNFYMPMLGMPEISIPEIDVYVEDEQIIKLGNIEIKVITTPGHTQGGVCYYTDGYLFSGDTIFRESIGRCDLEGGDYGQIVKSIKDKIFKLPENTVILPGHGKPTSVIWEKTHNLEI